MADPIINIQNVVATASVGQNFDLRSIAGTIPGVEYRPKRFQALFTG